MVKIPIIFQTIYTAHENAFLNQNYHSKNGRFKVPVGDILRDYIHKNATPSDESVWNEMQITDAIIRRCAGKIMKIREIRVIILNEIMNFSKNTKTHVPQELRIPTISSLSNIIFNSAKEYYQFKIPEKKILERFLRDYIYYMEDVPFEQLIPIILKFSGNKLNRFEIQNFVGELDLDPNIDTKRLSLVLQLSARINWNEIGHGSIKGVFRYTQERLPAPT